MRRRAGALLVVGAVVIVGGGAVVASGLTSSSAVAQSTAPPADTATIARKTLVATTQVDGTLGYAGSYAIANGVATSGGGSGGGAGAAQAYASAKAQYDQAVAALDALEHPASAASAQLRQAKDGVTAARAALHSAAALLDLPRGVLTQAAAVGSIVQPGRMLYTLDGGHPVVLMAGSVPAWRDLAPGVADGIDVKQLETNLRALGYAGDGLTIDAHWDAATTTAVKAWQKALGVAQTGSVALGAVVFEPTALRVTDDSATLGTTVQQGTPILQATSTNAVVRVALDPALQTKVAAGDTVSVTMPDGTSTAGTVSEVGTVATTPESSGPGGGNPTPTIEVTVALGDPSSTGGLDQAPVSVNITTATATNVLAVPVSALVELLEGGYAVQVRAADGTLHYVRVQLGLFAGGWVAVTGEGLSEGQGVVVAQ